MTGDTFGFATRTCDYVCEWDWDDDDAYVTRVWVDDAYGSHATRDARDAPDHRGRELHNWDRHAKALDAAAQEAAAEWQRCQGRDAAEDSADYDRDWYLAHN